MDRITLLYLILVARCIAGINVSKDTQVTVKRKPYIITTTTTSLPAMAPEKREIPMTRHNRNLLFCALKTEVEPGLILRLKTGNWRMNDPALKKWTLCMLVEAGIMSDEGVFRQDVALMNIPEKDKDKMEAMFDNCLSKNAIPPTEIAWEFMKCWERKKPKPKYAIF